MVLKKACPLCKNNKSKHSLVAKHVYGKSDSAFYLCDNCEVIFQHPGLTSHEEKISRDAFGGEEWISMDNLSSYCLRGPHLTVLV